MQWPTAPARFVPLYLLFEASEPSGWRAAEKLYGCLDCEALWKATLAYKFPGDLTPMHLWRLQATGEA